MLPASVLNRQHYRNQRRNLSAKALNDNALKVADLIVRQIFFLKARHLGFYLPTDAELDTWPLLEATLTYHNKRCYLPCMASRLDRHSDIWMRFQRYDPDLTPLQMGRYGLFEPVLNLNQRRSVDLLDVVFVPLVAFDTKGHRMGMGKGYYDRTFADRHLAWRRPLLVGLAHSVQEASALDTNDWDVPMDMVVTEEKILTFHHNRRSDQ